MKKIKIVMCIIFIIVGLMFTKVYAANPTVQVNGNTTLNNGENGKFTIHVNSDSPVGVVSGTVSQSNVSDIKIQGINGWQVTYNESTGKFNVINADGSKDADIAEITFKVSDNAKDNIWIKLNDKTTVATTDYEKIQLSGITKNITLKTATDNNKEDNTKVELSSIVVTKNPTKTSFIAGDIFDKTGLVITAQYSDGTKKEITNYTINPNRALTVDDKSITIRYTENDITKETKIDVTVAKKQENPSENTSGKNNEEVQPLDNVNKEDSMENRINSNVKDNKKLNEGNDKTVASKNIPETGVSYIIIAVIVLNVVVATISYRLIRNNL